MAFFPSCQVCVFSPVHKKMPCLAPLFPRNWQPPQSLQLQFKFFPLSYWDIKSQVLYIIYILTQRSVCRWVVFAISPLNTITEPERKVILGKIYLVFLFVFNSGLFLSCEFWVWGAFFPPSFGSIFNPVLTHPWVSITVWQPNKQMQYFVLAFILAWLSWGQWIGLSCLSGVSMSQAK